MSRGGKRDGAGRKPGVPNKASGEIHEIARQFGPAVIQRLAQLSGVAPGGLADSHAVQVAAMRELLDRGWGKATQLIGSDTDRPLAIDFRWADAMPQPLLEPGPAPLTIDVEAEAEDSDGVVVCFRKD
jgi:hypothetical protein